MSGMIGAWLAVAVVFGLGGVVALGHVCWRAGYRAGCFDEQAEVMLHRQPDAAGYVEGYQQGMADLIDAHQRHEWKVWPARERADPWQTRPALAVVTRQAERAERRWRETPQEAI